MKRIIDVKCLMFVSVLLFLLPIATSLADENTIYSFSAKPSSSNIIDIDRAELEDFLDPSLNVLEFDDSTWSWSNYIRSDYLVDYFEFLDRADPYLTQSSEPEIHAMFEAITDGQVVVLTTPMDPVVLQEELLERLHIDFLLDTIDSRMLKVIRTSHVDQGDYYESELLFKDPFVGTFQGILLMPKGTGPFPAVLAIHGHAEQARDFRDLHYGSQFPAHGYAILMLTMRIDEADYWEDMLTRIMLIEGFSLLGTRIYEAELGLKYLRYLSDVDNGRIGLIGHSGGAVISNLLVRIDHRFQALVTDCQGLYYYHIRTGQSDESNPYIYPYYRLINMFYNAHIPIRQEPYDYPNGPDGFFGFFDRNL